MTATIKIDAEHLGPYATLEDLQCFSDFVCEMHPSAISKIAEETCIISDDESDEIGLDDWITQAIGGQYGEWLPQDDDEETEDDELDYPCGGGCHMTNRHCRCDAMYEAWSGR